MGKRKDIEIKWIWMAMIALFAVFLFYPLMLLLVRSFQRVGAISLGNVPFKVGDTVADIKEGKNAGVITVGIIEGSSVMGLHTKNIRNCK